MRNISRNQYGMGSIDQIWNDYKGLFIVGGVAMLGWYLLKHRSRSSNPDATLDQASTVLEGIEDFAETHSRGEVSRVLDNVKSRFPVLAEEVEEARARVL